MQVLTWPFLGLTLLLLGRGWYVQLSSGKGWGSTWEKRSTLILIFSTALAGTLWGLRFAGIFGESFF
ncbi:MAG: hypothetical protein ACE5Q6_17175 [Dehalococcoidia bacterium]